MAHKITIRPEPHVNVDGSVSTTRKDHVVYHKHTGHKKERVGAFSSRAKAEAERDRLREEVVTSHSTRHPRDRRNKS